MELSPLQERRERVFLVLAAFFLGSMTLLNVVGITKFIQLGPLALAVGVLPYPITFLCTDLVGELFGKKRASDLVWVGLMVNIFVISVIFLGHQLPSVEAGSQPPWQTLFVSKAVSLPNGDILQGQFEFFDLIYACTVGSVFASMIAYLAAQFCDVHLFHFWKNLTKGKHLWLRNNGSTLISQLVDSFAVISITFGAVIVRGDMLLSQALMLMGSNYLFKMAAALADTIPFYICVRKLSKYLEIKS